MDGMETLEFGEGIADPCVAPLSHLQVDAKFDDAYFTKEKSATRNGTEAEFFKGDKAEKKAFPESKAADQKALDKSILAAVAQVPNLAKYLAATFGLTKGQHAHLMKF